MNKKEIISVILIVINVLFFGILIKLITDQYFSKLPDKEWWTALAIVVAISTAVFIVGINLILNQKEYKDKLNSLENRVMEAYKIISNITNVQDASENENEEIWKDLILEIQSIKDTKLIKPITLRTWSRIAWKNGYLNYALKLREKAFNLDKDDVTGRNMLCSALLHQEHVDITKIEFIFDNTVLNTDSQFVHFYNMKGLYYTRIKDYGKAVECYSKSITKDLDTWAYKGFITSLIMNGDDAEKIKSEVDNFSTNSQWYNDNVLSQKPFRLMIEAFLGTGKIDNFYKYFNTKNISEITQRYNNKFMKHTFFDFFDAVESRFNEEMQMIYLTYYYLIGSYDKSAEKKLENEDIIREINERIKNGL